MNQISADNDGRKGKIAVQISGSNDIKTVEESDGRKGKIATAVGN